MQIPESIRNQVEVLRLPCMPQVLLRFLALVEDDQVSLSELATLAGQDPALSARFLTVANSSPLRRDREIKSLDGCMTTLGTRLVRTVAESLAIEIGFARTGGDAGCDLGRIWRHSLRVAEMARAVAERTQYGDSDEAYLAGLLHDIGQLLLLGGGVERYGSWLQNIKVEAKLRDVEELLFGTDHAAVGAWLVDQWRLSSLLSDAILFHHKAHDEIVDADPLSKLLWCCHVVDSCREEDLATVAAMLGLDLTEILAIRDRSSERTATLATTLGVAVGAEIRQHEPGSPYSEVETRVRDMAVMQSLQQSLSMPCDEGEILLAVQESARILFGVGRPAFFFIQPDRPLLSAPDFAGQPVLLRQLSIRLDTGRGLAAAVVLGNKPRCTFDRYLPTAASLIDVQVARALGSEGVLYVPMCIRERQIGIMAYGLDSSQQVLVEKLLPRLAGFGRQAAVSIEAWRAQRTNEERVAESLTSRFQQHARKVVHEAGNPLGIIKNYLKIVSEKLPVENGGQELDILREEVDRVALILQRLGDLTETPPAKDSVEINGMIDGMLALYGESLFSSQGIVVEKELAPAPLPVTGDRDSIKQILLNLWSNAADALTSGDRICISTCDSVILNGRFYVEIRVSDSGPGLPPDVMQRLFQPLDSGRRPGHCGIGLSIVASLIESLDGLIKCRSCAGSGTSFVVLLPRSTDGRDHPGPRHADPPIPEAPASSGAPHACL